MSSCNNSFIIVNNYGTIVGAPSAVLYGGGEVHAGSAPSSPATGTTTEPEQLFEENKRANASRSASFSISNNYGTIVVAAGAVHVGAEVHAGSASTPSVIHNHYNIDSSTNNNYNIGSGAVVGSILSGTCSISGNGRISGSGDEVHDSSINNNYNIGSAGAVVMDGGSVSGTGRISGSSNEVHHVTETTEPELQDEEQEPPRKRLKSDSKNDGGTTDNQISFSNDTIGADTVCGSSGIHAGASVVTSPASTTETELPDEEEARDVEKTLDRTEYSTLLLKYYDERDECYELLNKCTKAYKERDEAFEERDKSTRRSDLEIAHLESEVDRLNNELDEQRRIVKMLGCKCNV